MAIQGKSRQEQIKANQGKANQGKANQGKSRGGDILPVIMLIFKSSHQFLYRSQDIRTNVSITLFFFFRKSKRF
jgi:hypothetical protein